MQIAISIFAARFVWLASRIVYICTGVSFFRTQKTSLGKTKNIAGCPFYQDISMYLLVLVLQEK